MRASEIMCMMRGQGKIFRTSSVCCVVGCRRTPILASLGTPLCLEGGPCLFGYTIIVLYYNMVVAHYAQDYSSCTKCLKIASIGRAIACALVGMSRKKEWFKKMRLDLCKSHGFDVFLKVLRWMSRPLHLAYACSPNASKSVFYEIQTSRREVTGKLRIVPLILQKTLNASRHRHPCSPKRRDRQVAVCEGLGRRNHWFIDHAKGVAGRKHMEKPGRLEKNTPRLLFFVARVEAPWLD